MQTRCKVGDLAIIIKEEPGLDENLGRMVRLHGPARWDATIGDHVWVFEAVGAPMRYINIFGVIDHVPCPGCNEHPDGWLLPVLPSRSATTVNDEGIAS